eukprot:Blabericola_migrator_1__8362@NODE_434_length_8507_cov_92_389692_g340_i0_p3_GENE_NODE_434_length_8507_cov_92_389692_g340_i0NODE_434_length_8507_cov_92_389692_g340_i0_p3_ORF_typecomplete_len456_score58_56_NODE_434_length_8507_cov_92_389692_g340_i067948161
MRPNGTWVPTHEPRQNCTPARKYIEERKHVVKVSEPWSGAIVASTPASSESPKSEDTNVLTNIDWSTVFAGSPTPLTKSMRAVKKVALESRSETPATKGVSIPLARKVITFGSGDVVIDLDEPGDEAVPSGNAGVSRQDAIGDGTHAASVGAPIPRREEGEIPESPTHSESRAGVGCETREVDAEATPRAVEGAVSSTAAPVESAQDLFAKLPPSDAFTTDHVPPQPSNDDIGETGNLAKLREEVPCADAQGNMEAERSEDSPIVDIVEPQIPCDGGSASSEKDSDEAVPAVPLTCRVRRSRPFKVEAGTQTEQPPQKIARRSIRAVALSIEQSPEIHPITKPAENPTVKLPFVEDFNPYGLSCRYHRCGFNHFAPPWSATDPYSPHPYVPGPLCGLPAPFSCSPPYAWPGDTQRRPKIKVEYSFDDPPYVMPASPYPAQHPHTTTTHTHGLGTI